MLPESTTWVFGASPYTSLNAVPAIIYDRVKALARILQVTLVLHGSLGQPLSQHKPYDPTKYETDDGIAELMLVSLVIVVLKLHYGYDDQGCASRRALGSIR